MVHHVLRISLPVLSAALTACATTPRFPLSDHYDGKRFHNPDRNGSDKSFLTVMKWMWTRSPSKWPKEIQNQKQPPPPIVADAKLVATFVNHASVLIQMKGFNILTDPHFSERASPVQWAGPKRVRPPGVRFEDLPRIDVVLISHNHYDHLDLNSLKRLEEAHQPLFLTGLGNKEFLKGQGLTRVEEFDWYGEKNLDAGEAQLRVAFVPAQHFSARGLFDRNKTLWGGFVIEGDGGRVFFAGDSAYHGHFKQVREKYGAPDLALIPIGAYDPRWFMQAAHVNPEEAVQAHVDLEARASIGIHFGTFQLTDEEIDDPPKRLEAELKRRGLEPTAFRALGFGETVRF